MRKHAESTDLGEQYAGRSVARKVLASSTSNSLDDSNGSANEDEIVNGDSEEIQEDEDETSNVNGDSEEIQEDEDETSNVNGDSEETQEEEDETSKEEEEGKDATRAEMHRILAQDRQAIASTMSSAAKADVAKGRALRTQQRTFDSLANVRIKLQKSLVASNSLADDDDLAASSEQVARAETTALKLWTDLNLLRRKLYDFPEVESPTESSACWEEMQQHETHFRPSRRRVLDKWSQRANPISTSRVSKQALSQVVDQQLLGNNMARLVSRTRVPQSCAPKQLAAKMSEAEIFDDADFYTLLLRELVNSRARAGVSASLLKSLPSQKDLQPRKQVDTKASKGRKMRYTTHEKLVNFLVPEDRGSWQERQREELFASLFGQSNLAEVEQHDSDPGDLPLFG